MVWNVRASRYCRLVIDTASEQILAGLNSEQRAAVTSDAQKLVIRAGAGSGKTRVLTRRIAYGLSLIHI